MKITVDTNVLVRAAMRDDATQTQIAARILAEAQTVVVPLVALCEFGWVLKRIYRQDAVAIAGAIRRLLAASKVHTDRAAAEAGLAVLSLGGDFADGAISHAGARDGGAIFASFDRSAVKLVGQTGGQVLDLNAFA